MPYFEAEYHNAAAGDRMGATLAHFKNEPARTGATDCPPVTYEEIRQTASRWAPSFDLN
jgi:hypothetical protein